MTPYTTEPEALDLKRRAEKEHPDKRFNIGYSSVIGYFVYEGDNCHPCLQWDEDGMTWRWVGPQPKEKL